MNTLTLSPRELRIEPMATIRPTNDTEFHSIENIALACMKLNHGHSFNSRELSNVIRFQFQIMIDYHILSDVLHCLHSAGRIISDGFNSDGMQRYTSK